MNKKLIGLLIILLITLAGCSPTQTTSEMIEQIVPTDVTPEATATQPPPPTPTEVPLTATLEPTATLLPTATPVTITISEELIGTWHKTTPSVYGGEIYRQFRDDGTYRVASSVAELESKPRVIGNYSFEDNILILDDISGDPPWDECVVSGQQGKYEVQRLENGNIVFKKIEDECMGRSMIMPQGQYELIQ